MIQLNPEENPRLRAMLYVIGCGGLVHLSTLLILAVVKRDAAYFHPLYTIDVDQLWPASRNSWLVYITGWLVFFGLIYFVTYLLRRTGGKDT
jgi:hypothetical protein